MSELDKLDQENAIRFEQTCLEESGGDYKRALRLSCENGVRWYRQTSLGYGRERYWHARIAANSAKPRVEPVLLESERTVTNHNVRDR